MSGEKKRRQSVSYSDEHRQFLEANVLGRSYEALAVLFNQEFDTNIGRLAISKLCRRFGLSNGKPNRRPYSDEQIDFLRSNVNGRHYEELAKMFNEHFGTNVSAGRIGELCRRRVLSNGLDCRYSKGHIKGKGRKMPGSFPDGSEYISAAGYVVMKHNGIWRGKHTIIWEQAHGQPVPKGHYIVFGDSNKRNFDPSNLFCISAAQSAIRSTMGLQGATPELAEAGIALAKLYDRINQHKRKTSEKNGGRCKNGASVGINRWSVS